MTATFRAIIVSCLLATLHLPAWGQSLTAAELDWVPHDPRDRSDHRCRGTYVEPLLSEGPLGDRVRARANESEHRMNHYTVFSGDVVITQAGREIRSPRISFGADNSTALMDGPLIIREPGVVMTGSSATADLSEDTTRISDATFLFHAAGLRGSAASLEKLESGDIVLSHSEFTRCDPDSQAWAIHGGQVKVEPDSGFATAKQVTLRVGNVPVIWLPWIRFPVDDERHSGFLMPGGGYDSSGGTEISAPYYFNLAPHMDATWQPRSMWKRGLIHEGQFRFLLGQSMSEINAGYIHRDDAYDNRRLLDGTLPGTDLSGVDLPDLERQSRWYLNLRHSGGQASRWKTTINYNAVSDREYVDDIGGNLGSDVINNYVNSIDQALTDRRAPALDKRGSIEYRGDNWTTSATLQDYQILDPLAPPQYAVLPQLLATYRTGFGPIALNGLAEYTWFDKDAGGLGGFAAITGSRGVMDLGASMRRSTIWGFIEPGLGVIHRSYDLARTPAGIPANPQITIPRFHIDAGLYFDRFFDLRNNGYHQTLEPRVFYLYVGEEPQSDLPAFDTGVLTPGFAQLFRVNRFSGHDRIGDANQLSLALTTRLLNPETGSQYLEASIGQIQYFKDREINFGGGPGDDPQAERSAIFTEARIRLGDRLGISGGYEWEPRSNRSNRGAVSIKYHDKDNRLFNLSYTYTSPEIQALTDFQSTEESDFSTVLPIKGGWSAIGRWNFSWDRHQTIESFVGVEYDDCCWRSRLLIRRFLKSSRDVSVLVNDPDNPGGLLTETHTGIPSDTGIFFEFQMKGMATLGRKLDLLLEQTIPGYRDREAIIGS